MATRSYREFRYSVSVDTFHFYVWMNPLLKSSCSQSGQIFMSNPIAKVLSSIPAEILFVFLLNVEVARSTSLIRASALVGFRSFPFFCLEWRCWTRSSSRTSNIFRSFRSSCIRATRGRITSVASFRQDPL